MRATRKTFSETSTGSGAPLPCFRVSVLRATPSFSASTELERPKVAATCSNMLAGKPRRTPVRISFAGRSASENADCICAEPTPNGLMNWATRAVYLDSVVSWQALRSQDLQGGLDAAFGRNTIGSGRNLPRYPSAVREILALEPDPSPVGMARKSLSASPLGGELPRGLRREHTARRCEHRYCGLSLDDVHDPAYSRRTPGNAPNPETWRPIAIRRARLVA